MLLQKESEHLAALKDRADLLNRLHYLQQVLSAQPCKIVLQMLSTAQGPQRAPQNLPEELTLSCHSLHLEQLPISYSDYTPALVERLRLMSVRDRLEVFKSFVCRYGASCGASTLCRTVQKSVASERRLDKAPPCP